MSSFINEIRLVAERCARRRTGRTARAALFTWVLQAADSERNFTVRLGTVAPGHRLSEDDESSGRIIGRALYVGGWQPNLQRSLLSRVLGGTDDMDDIEWIRRAYTSTEGETELVELAKALVKEKARMDAGEAPRVPRAASPRDEKPRDRTSPTRIQVVLPAAEHKALLERAEESGRAVSAIAAELIQQGLHGQIK